MSTDFFRSEFPTYVKTGDTKVVPFKYYFRKDGRRYVRVTKSVASDNPASLGWYEESSVHNSEFSQYLENNQINGIATICNMLTYKLSMFPNVTLDRQVGDVDWSQNVVDTVFDELISSVPMSTDIPFSTNLFVVRNIQKFVLDATAVIAGGATVTDAKLAFVKTFADKLTVNSTYRTYGNAGYTFDRSTLGSTSRSDDTYTLAYSWQNIDFRHLLLMLHNFRDLITDKASSTYLGYTEKIIAVFTRAARTMVKLAKLVAEIKIKNSSVMTCKTVVAPKTIVFNGTTYYRLDYSNQLVAGKRYGSAISDWEGNVSLVDVNVVQSPVAMFSHRNLPKYTAGTSVEDITVTYMTVQNGEVWYTEVNVNGS